MINAWAACPGKIKNGWNIVIAGWGDEYHIRELISKIETLKVKKNIHFIGAQYGSAKHACFKSADAFILPSYSEGLPMSILEAWSYSLPVLMTNQCNLQIGFTSNSAVKIEPKKDGILEGLRELFVLTERERHDYGHRGRKLVETSYSWPLVSGQMCEVYYWMLGYGSRPDCVIVN